MGITLIWIMLYATMRERSEEFLIAHFSLKEAGMLAVLPMAVPALFGMAWTLMLAWRLDKKYRVPCPHCGKNLLHGAAVVIASKHCPYCGERVIDGVS